jgi:hypothetical protein
MLGVKDVLIAQKAMGKVLVDVQLHEVAPDPGSCTAFHNILLPLLGMRENDGFGINYVFAIRTKTCCRISVEKFRKITGGSNATNKCKVLKTRIHGGFIGRGIQVRDN